jgi:hypothetical protein
MKKYLPIISWILRIIAAGILLQTLYFKFGGKPEAVYIFSTLGVEPWGRIALGVLELITAILLLLPSTVWLGAVVGVGLMVGALGAHVAILGIEVQDDGGNLFILALLTLVACTAILFIHQDALKAGLSRIVGNRS